MKPEITDIVICDHGQLVEGSDSGHLAAVLKGVGYKVRYVPRCYEGRDDVDAISGFNANVVLADPSVHSNGRRVVDSGFLKGLEQLCRETRAYPVFFALAPEELGMKGVLDKTNHPSVVETVNSYFIMQPS